MMEQAAGRAVSILLVEDDPRDVELTRAALKLSQVDVELTVVNDGDEALRHLGALPADARPHLVLLDLNMPRMDGRETLRALKADPDLRRLPVVVLSTSDHDDDIRGAYDLQAACYIVKPVELEAFVDAVKALEAFWGRVVTYCAR